MNFRLCGKNEENVKYLSDPFFILQVMKEEQ